MVDGDLVLPDEPTGLVVFAHGSGSSRHSPRNRAVAATLNRAGFATLLLDLLTADEERRDAATGELRFDVELLGRRLASAADQAGIDLPIGYFGASTGGSAAIVAAVDRPEGVRAIVSRGGRPDLAGRRLAQLRVPTLLIVGGADTTVLELNRAAAKRIRAEVEMAVIPGATHLFPERGALDRVAALAADWFSRFVPAPRT